MNTPAHIATVGALEQDPKARAKLRGQLRAARGVVLADAEGFEVLVHAIESVGRWVVPSGSNLAKYTPSLIHLVTTALGWQEGDNQVRSLRASLFLLRQTRNDYAHEGVHARNAADEAVGVALLLEEALSFSWADVRLQDVMVRRPVVADADDTLGEIRRAMLSHSYSFVPVRLAGIWRLVSERWLADQVVGKLRKGRGAEFARPVSDFEGELPEARVFDGDEPTSSLTRPLPDLLLVAETPSAKVLLGVVSPSDLL
jgi:CBS domain-containing protein